MVLSWSITSANLKGSVDQSYNVEGPVSASIACCRGDHKGRSYIVLRSALLSLFPIVWFAFHDGPIPSDLAEAND